MCPEARGLCPYSHELKIAVRTWIKESLPRPVVAAAKSVARRCGVKFYSEGI